MKINGLLIDEQNIANGLYAIICEQGQDHIVAYGMIPAEIMECLAKLLREKMIALAAAQRRMTAEEFAPYVDEAIIKDMIQKISHEVCIGIYRAAKEAGKMLV